MRKLVALLVLVAGTAFADEPVRKLIDVKYVSYDQVARLAQTFGAMVAHVGNGVAVSGSQGAIEAFELALKKVDLPPTDVELTGYMVAASKDGAQGSELPPALAPVVAQLRGLLAFKEFRLLDTFRVRVRCGANNFASASGDTPAGLHYSFGVNYVGCSDAKDQQIHIQGLNLQVTRPAAKVELRTDLDLKEGQQVVVGKAGFADGPLILVLSARRMP